MMFSPYFETEEDYIKWQKNEAEAEVRRASHRLEVRELKATRVARRPVLFSTHTISKSVAKERPDDNMACVWVEESIEPITGTYIGYRYKFNGKWTPNPDNYYEPGEGYYFGQTKTVEVWLFVIHENRNPIAVFPFEIKEEAE
jgi:hypothetical protein